ncbi:MAG: glycosyltransferase family 2 protein, partial [Planctomycetales bacterium]
MYEDSTRQLATHTDRIALAIENANRLLDEFQQLEANPQLSIIIPVHNQKGPLPELIHRVAALPVNKEILIIDNGSTDEVSTTIAQLAEQYEEVTTYRHERFRGKGAALRTGFAAARGEVIAIQDASLAYDPRDLLMLIKPILAGRCDVVYGS